MSSSTAAAIAEEELAREESIYPSSSLYHDGIILPSETRLVNIDVGFRVQMLGG